MKTTTHTPGPWKAKEQFRDCTSNDTGYFILWQDTSKSGVVWRRLDDKYSNGGSFKEADAKLIAAAPELLEALKAMVDSGFLLCHNAGDVPEWNKGGHAYEAINKASAAVAKAQD